MSSKGIRSRTVFLASMLVAACFLGAGVPEAHAWNMSANPMSRSTVPGGTVTYTVSVFYDTPTDALFPSVLLLVSPPEPQVTVTFTYSNPDPHPPPYTATMTVHVDSSKPPGTYTLFLWANPSGTPFPGPGNRQMNVNLVVEQAQPAWDIVIDVDPKNPTTVPGGRVDCAVTVRVEWYSGLGQVVVEGIHLLVSPPIPGLTVIFSPNDGGVDRLTPFTSTMTVLVDSSTPPGDYALHVWADIADDPPRFPGPYDRETTVGLDVRSGAVFGFNIAFSPGSVEVKQGETAYYDVLLAYSDPSYSGTDVKIHLSGLGSGMDWHLTTSGVAVETSPTTSTGTYTITVTGSAMGVTRQASATLVVTPGQPPPLETMVDWTVLSVAVSPATPNVGDAVTFSMDMTALSSSMPFPQDVVVECQVDPPASQGGVECFFETVTFPGPTGKSFPVTSKTPWFPTPGTHTLMWDISTTGDPNPGDNAKTVSFMVLGTTTTESPLPPPQTEPPPSSPQTSITIPPPPGPSFSDLTWIIIGILVVLIVIFAAFALRGRQPAYKPPPSQPAPPAVAEKPGRSPLYCVHCGTENPSTNEFCGKCGKELLRVT